jgi:hypothetical protein
LCSVQSSSSRQFNNNSVDKITFEDKDDLNADSKRCDRILPPDLYSDIESGGDSGEEVDKRDIKRQEEDSPEEGIES